MDLKTKMRIAINNSKPSEIIETAVQVAEKHIHLSNLLAIQDYLLRHGANDEKVNEQIKELKKL